MSKDSSTYIYKSDEGNNIYFNHSEGGNFSRYTYNGFDCKKFTGDTYTRITCFAGKPSDFKGLFVNNRAHISGSYVINEDSKFYEELYLTTQPPKPEASDSQKIHEYANSNYTHIYGDLGSTPSNCDIVHGETFMHMHCTSTYGTFLQAICVDPRDAQELKENEIELAGNSDLDH